MNQEKLQMQRHSMAHVMAKAITRLYPNAKLTIGPAVDNGFYYDIDADQNFDASDFEKITKEMKTILGKNEKFVRKVVSKQQAMELFSQNEYKLELIGDLAENDEISVYYLGDDFVDLCRGPHVEGTSNLQNLGFKITKCNGAYWRGNEKNKMLKRIYALCFSDKKQLFEYEKAQEEALKRDHNKLGRELGYFTTVDIIGQGLPILLPNGAKVIQILQRFVEDEEEKRGWLLTKTPYMAKSDLYKLSGHWDHYRDGMFVLGDEKKDKEVYALRPMTCPFQYQAYLNQPRSYRDLPLRYNETSTLFRNESSGEMHGLIRVRQFTISEGHLMCTPAQLSNEFKNCLVLANYVLKTLGLDGDVSYRFSQWDPNNRAKYIGTKEQWDEAQNVMKNILDSLNIKYSIGVGEAAFYGPKLDIQLKNVFGKEDTIITIQIDQLLAEKFGMYYTDADGEKKVPTIIHRTSLGCYERTLAYLIEKYAGALPLWLMPTQVVICNLTDSHLEYANQICQMLKDKGIRARVDARNEKIGFKIRESTLAKTPYTLILGDNEVQNKTISYRARGNVQVAGVTVDDFIAKLKEEIDNKKI